LRCCLRKCCCCHCADFLREHRHRSIVDLHSYHTQPVPFHSPTSTHKTI
jgi:hypothetical protein